MPPLSRIAAGLRRCNKVETLRRHLPQGYPEAPRHSLIGPAHIEVKLAVWHQHAPRVQLRRAVAVRAGHLRMVHVVAVETHRSHEAQRRIATRQRRDLWR
jgi:hypothetical protein